MSLYERVISEAKSAKISDFDSSVLHSAYEVMLDVLRSVPKERAKWGEKSAQMVLDTLLQRGVSQFAVEDRLKGKGLSWKRLTYKITNAILRLEKMGLLRRGELDIATSSELHKGKWGHWLGGTKKSSSSEIYVAATPKGEHLTGIKIL